MSTPHQKDIVRQVEYWGDKFTPACACGCGEPVKISNKGPGKYVNQAHNRWVNQPKAAKAGGLATRGDIEIEKFRTMLQKVKDEKGWTWDQMAEAGGWSDGHLHNCLYKDEVKGIREETARKFLRRCLGLPEQMSERQIKVEREREKKLKRWEKDQWRNG